MRRLNPPRGALAALVLSSILPLAAQTNPASFFDFSASVASLAAAVEAGDPLPEGRYVLLTGTLRSAESTEGSPYAVRVELVSGEWEGTSRVVLRSVYVDCSGDSYRAFFDRESPDYIRLGSTVLTVARVAGTAMGEDGILRVLLEGIHIRRLDS